MADKARKFSDFVAYMEKLATRHKDIRHSDTEKHFYRLELEEFLTGMHKMKYPALAMEGYWYGFRDAKSDNPIKQRYGAFILVKHVSDPGNYDLVHQAWDELEVIGDDILAKMKQDKRDVTSPVYDFDLESVEARLVATEINNQYGIRYTFTIGGAMNMDVDESKWIPES